MTSELTRVKTALDLDLCATAQSDVVAVFLYGKCRPSFMCIKFILEKRVTFATCMINIEVAVDCSILAITLCVASIDKVICLKKKTLQHIFKRTFMYHYFLPIC